MKLFGKLWFFTKSEIFNYRWDAEGVQGVFLVHAIRHRAKWNRSGPIWRYRHALSAWSEVGITRLEIDSVDIWGNCPVAHNFCHHPDPAVYFSRGHLAFYSVTRTFLYLRSCLMQCGGISHMYRAWLMHWRVPGHWIIYGVIWPAVENGHLFTFFCSWGSILLPVMLFYY